MGGAVLMHLFQVVIDSPVYGSAHEGDGAHGIIVTDKFKELSGRGEATDGCVE